MRTPVMHGVIGTLTLVLAAGCASGGMGGATMSKQDAIAARQQLMKEQAAAMKTIGDSAKAGQLNAIPAAAEKLQGTAKRIPALFPEGSLDPATSRAKPEIWQKWAEFQSLAKTLESKAGQLAATAKSGNAQATNTAVADIGKTTCGACHTGFRGPEIKK
jgi:cytochrome c556